MCIKTSYFLLNFQVQIQFNLNFLEFKELFSAYVLNSLEKYLL